MGKGIAKRHREKRAKDANIGNLHKAAIGKARLGPRLPTAPKKEELVDKLPKSLRKMMSLQAAAKKHQDAKQGRGGPKAVDKGSEGRQASGQQATASGRTAQQQSEGAPGKGQQASVKDHKAAADPAASSKGHEGKQQPDTGKKDGKLYVTSAFEQTTVKGLKQRKKEYLNRKKEQKKKGKKGGKAAGDEMTAVEARLALKQMDTRARFGEVADAPLEVHLKRKHWVEQPGELVSEPPGTSARMAKILQQQLTQAQAKATASKSVAPTAKKAKSAQGAATQQAPMSLLQRAKEEVRLAQEKAQLEHARLQAVAAYRANKSSKAGHTATMASLKALVKRGQAAAAQASAIQ